MTSGVPDGAATWAAWRSRDEVGIEVADVIVRTDGRERSINGLFETSVIEAVNGVQARKRRGASVRGETESTEMLFPRGQL